MSKLRHKKVNSLVQGHTATASGFKPRYSGPRTYAYDHCISVMKGYSLGRTEKAETEPAALGRPEKSRTRSQGLERLRN